MATIYAEALMAQKYKQVGDDGTVTGGPVYYIRAAFTGKFGKILAATFAVLIIFALGFMGNAVQSTPLEMHSEQHLELIHGLSVLLSQPFRCLSLWEVFQESLL